MKDETRTKIFEAQAVLKALSGSAVAMIHDQNQATDVQYAADAAWSLLELAVDIEEK